jgi:hypothetical protein
MTLQSNTSESNNPASIWLDTALIPAIQHSRAQLFLNNITSYDVHIGTGPSSTSNNKHAPSTSWLSVQNVTTVRDLVALLYSETNQTKTVRYIVHVVREKEEVLESEPEDSVPFSLSLSKAKRNRSETSAAESSIAKKEKPTTRTKVKQEKEAGIKLEPKSAPVQFDDLSITLPSYDLTDSENDILPDIKDLQETLAKEDEPKSRYGRVQKPKVL